MSGELLLVGSVPLDGPEQVMEACGQALADYVPCLPDGETGDRRNWIDFVALRAFHGHPQIETVRRPRSGNFSDPKSFWAFRLRPGVSELRFDGIGYAGESIASYETFKELRAAGRIAAGVRFQVGLPLTGSGVDNFFRDAADREIVRPAYEDAMRREIARMLAHIPADDLAIQWDVCVEVLDIFGAIPWTRDEPADEKFERHVAPLGRVSREIPEDVLLGFHFCYGTLGGWPMVALADLSLCVRLANEAVERSGRLVDFVHMPVIPQAGEEYFAPLRDLAADRARVYLGLIHHTDGVEGFRRRTRQARAVLPEFGVASVCGYGRLDATHVAPVLDLHRQCAELVRRREV